MVARGSWSIQTTTTPGTTAPGTPSARTGPPGGEGMLRQPPATLEARQGARERPGLQQLQQEPHKTEGNKSFLTAGLHMKKYPALSLEYF